MTPEIGNKGVVYMTQRDYNVDLFRILASIFVIILHVLGQGGILQQAAPGSMVYWSAWTLEITAFCAVNCFALISGYVMVDKTIKAKNIVGLWVHALFYSLLFTAVFFVFVPETRTLRHLVVACLPIVGKQWWYMSAYFALYLFVPVLNAGVRQIPQKNLQKFLILILFGIGILDRALLHPREIFRPAIWLMILYLFGAYIRKYNVKEKITARKSLLFFLATIALTLLSKVVIRFVTGRFLGEVKYDDFLIAYPAITMILASVFLLLFCLNLKISNTARKMIMVFSPATLGIYLIHVHPLVFEYIFKDAFVSFAHQPCILMIAYTLAATLVIFLLCAAIDLLRIQLFKLLRVAALCETVNGHIATLYEKAFKH